MGTTYTVRYKLANGWFWKTVENVKGDGIMTTETNYPVRFFITSEEERVEIPIPGTQFRFSKERFISIKQKMDQEAGFDVKVRS